MFITSIRTVAIIVCALLFLGCSASDGAGLSGIESRLWLRKLDPATEVLRVVCTGEVKTHAGWETVRTETVHTAQEVLETSNQHFMLEWEALIDLLANETGLATWAAAALDRVGISVPTYLKRLLLGPALATPPTRNVNCVGEQLKYPPPVQITRCALGLDEECYEEEGVPDPDVAEPTIPTPIPQNPGGGDHL